MSDLTDHYRDDAMLSEIDALTAERDQLRERERVLSRALSAMLTHMGMDEDEWNKPTFDQARKALSQ